MSSLDELYQELSAKPSDINGHLPILRSLVERSNAQVVIELGVRSGVSSVAFLAGLEATGGHLYSVDIDPEPELGLELDLSDRWTFLQGDDLSTRIYEGLPYPADIVFIDTSHFYEQTRKELELYHWKVRRGGSIVCHDTQLAQPIGAPPRPEFPVRVAVEEFTSARGYVWRDHGPWPGLGVIDVR